MKGIHKIASLEGLWLKTTTRALTGEASLFKNNCLNMGGGNFAQTQQILKILRNELWAVLPTAVVWGGWSPKAWMSKKG